MLRHQTQIKYPLSVVPSFIASCDEGPEAHSLFCVFFIYVKKL